MSAKKKPQQTFSDCQKCGSLVLIKDAQAHSEFCGRPLDESKISLLVPKVAMKGYLVEVDRVLGRFLGVYPRKLTL